MVRLCLLCKQNVLYLGVHVINTTDTHNKGQLSLILHVKATLLLGFTLESDKVFFLQQAARQSGCCCPLQRAACTLLIHAETAVLFECAAVT